MRWGGVGAGLYEVGGGVGAGLYEGFLPVWIIRVRGCRMHCYRPLNVSTAHY